MPSHVTHLLHAEEIVARSAHAADIGAVLHAPVNDYLVLGAQGPDIFYHNQRRRPTGLAYGSLMHRRGYGATVAAMWEWAREHGAGIDSWASAFIVGFASHAILDRHTHPYINARSGWPEPGKPETDRFRSMHPFLERLIDVALLDRMRGIHPNELDFHHRVSCGESPPQRWVELMSHALAAAYRKAADDTRLSERLASAYLDSMGYYRYTNHVDPVHLEAGLRREENGEVGSRWLSIVHPLSVPSSVDVLNLEHTEWPHPCSRHESSTADFPELYDRAVAEGAAVVDSIVDAWDLPVAEGKARIEAAVANWNLSDGRPAERPCGKRFAAPLPLREAQERIRASIRNGRGGYVS